VRRFFIGTSCSVALLLACASALSAQDTTFVHQGARVRVTFEARTEVADHSGSIWYSLEPVRLVGSATMLKSDTLVFLPEDAESPLSIPRSRIETIEVSHGKKSNIGKGAWIGAVGGVVAGAVFGALVECGDWSRGQCVLAGVIIFAPGGAILGTGIGALLPSERWIEAEIPAPAPVALNVGKDGSVRLAFSVRL